MLLYSKIGFKRSLNKKRLRFGINISVDEPGNFFIGSALGSLFDIEKKWLGSWLPLLPKKSLALALARLRLWLF